MSLTTTAATFNKAINAGSNNISTTAVPSSNGHVTNLLYTNQNYGRLTQNNTWSGTTNTFNNTINLSGGTALGLLSLDISKNIISAYTANQNPIMSANDIPIRDTNGNLYARGYVLYDNIGTNFAGIQYLTGSNNIITVPSITGTLITDAGTQTISGNKTFSGTSTYSGLINTTNKITNTGTAQSLATVNNEDFVTREWVDLYSKSYINASGVALLSNQTPAVVNVLQGITTTITLRNNTSDWSFVSPNILNYVGSAVSGEVYRVEANISANTNVGTATEFQIAIYKSTGGGAFTQIPESLSHVDLGSSGVGVYDRSIVTFCFDTPTAGDKYRIYFASASTTVVQFNTIQFAISKLC